MPGLANMTRAERIAKAAAIAARGQRHTDSAPPLTGRAAQIQRDADHFNAVMALQNDAHPSKMSRMAKAEKLASRDRPAGY